MSLPAKTHGTDLSAYARTIAIAKCRCGRTPAIGVIRDPFDMRVIEAIEVRCGCGAWMQEAIDFDESYAKDYPSAAEKVRAALYHWAMAVKYNLPLNQPANIDRLIRIAEKNTLPGYETRLEYLGNSAELVLRIERNPMGMKKYIGTKIILAAPLTCGAWCSLRGWPIPANENGDDEGFMVEYTDGGKPNLEGHEGYVSWTPAEQFEKAYRPNGGLSFGLAIEAMKLGKKVARAGWNGKGMFLFLVAGSVFKVNRDPLLGIYPEGTEITYGAHIDIKAVDGSVRPWVASQSDMLADDWMIIE